MIRAAAAATVLVLAAALTACTQASPQTAPAPASPRPTPSTAAGVMPTGTPADVVTGLEAPWSMVALDPADGDDGDVLISERDSAEIERMSPAGELTSVGTVPGVVHQGEGGLLGLAVLAETSTTWVYAYLTSADDNRIVRMTYDDGALGDPEVVLDGLAKAGNHNGGRIAFGPDGMLYATVGDAGSPEAAQDPASRNGKILRMTPTGAVPGDNPTAGSLVYSMGHRNPQGLAWDAAGQLWAAEFGQDTWDEFNRIEPGGNYGWPVVEGISGGSAGSEYIDPWIQWPTDDASPSGLAYVDGTFFLASLKGARVWAISVDDAAGTAAATPFFVGEFGRIRDVAAGPGDTLRFLTNNTDGRGSPRDGDDRILSVSLVPAASASSTPAPVTPAAG